MLGSGTLWISVLTSCPKVKAHFREPGAGQSVTLSPLTLPQSRDQAAGSPAHVVRRAGRGRFLGLGAGHQAPPR